MDLKFKIGTTEVIKDTPVDEGSVIFDKKGKIHLDADGKRVEISGGVGEKTPEGGEIFNDYEHNIAGGKGFIITNKAKTDNGKGYYVLEGYAQYVINHPEETSYAVGDIWSAHIKNAYDFWGTIEKIDGDKIYVSNYVEGADDTDPWVFWVHTKPGFGNLTIGDLAHAEGRNTVAIGQAAHAEGRDTIANEKYAHAEGRQTKAAYASHAEGCITKASGLYSHAEGYTTTASGKHSHSEGSHTYAKGKYSHAEGYYTIAQNDCSHASGSFNSITKEILTDVSLFEGVIHDEAKKSNLIEVIDGEGVKWYLNNTSGYKQYVFAYDGFTVGKTYTLRVEFDCISNSEAATKQFENGVVKIDSWGWPSLDKINTNSEKEALLPTTKLNLSKVKNTVRIDVTPVKHKYISIRFYNWEYIDGEIIVRSVNIVNKEIDTDIIHSIGNGTSEENRSNAFAVYQDGHAEVQFMGETNNSVVTKEYVDQLLNRIIALETQIANLTS